MNRQEYAAYLESPHWLETRDRIRDLLGTHCELCGAGEWADLDPNEDETDYSLTAVHLHHITYENLGREGPCDLAVLCRACHKDVHEFPERKSRVLRFTLYRRVRQGFLRGAEAEDLIDRLAPATVFPTEYVLEESAR